MPYKVKNWKLMFLGVLCICGFMKLGYWQLARAQEKEILLANFAKRTEAPPLNVQTLNNISEKRYYRITLTGRFDNQHILLLDNKTFHSQVGYEIYTLFYATGISTPILIDRGFIPIGISRQQLPTLRPITNPVTLTGLLDLPPTYFTLGHTHESFPLHWPLRVAFIDLPQLTTTLHTPLFPYILRIDPKNPAAYPLEWQQVTTVSSVRHRAYALQWFAFALTLLILCIVLNRDHVQKGVT
ncbi:MAG TPA: SURF1 family protein [Gammaproteobacteria bacterium]|nr:SURF1 family protein [Gammaproteobacteria bacterium]